MANDRTDLRGHDDGGKLILRLTLGGLIILHGIAKVTGGVAGIQQGLAGVGMPPIFAYGVYVGEVLAPILILIGLWTRLAAVIVMINMVVAVLLVHTHEFFTLGKTGGWALELQGFFFLTALAVALLGAGRYSLGGVNGRWN